MSDAADPMGNPRVLIDGYNLAMRQGTGIKTYTGLLDDALKSLGADTSFLFGHPIPKDADPLLREVLFYDDQPDRINTPFGAFFRKLDIWGRAATNNAQAIQQVPDTGVVVLKSGPRMSENAFNSPSLFEIGWRRSLSFGKYLDVKMAEKFDALHLTFPLPVRIDGPMKIVTIHDVIPLRLPYTTMDDKNEMLRRHRTAVAEADLIYTVSEHSKKDIVHLLDADPDKVVVTHQPSRFKPIRGPELRDQAKMLRRRGLKPQEYVLFAGAIEPKKNLGRFVRAYAEADVDVPLVIAGPRAWMWEQEIGWIVETTDPELRRKIRFLDHVQVEELRFLMSGAMALAFPSLYEGYGLPLVEAMSFGVPAITSRASSMPEVCGDAALYIDPFDVRDMREKIERIVGDKTLREYLSVKAFERTAQLSPENFAQQVAAGYRRIGLMSY